MVASSIFGRFVLSCVFSSLLISLIGTTYSRAMPVVYSSCALRALRPSRDYCKHQHRDVCAVIRAAGCHCHWVSCSRGIRGGRLQRLLTSSCQQTQMTAMTAMRGSVTHPRESSLPHGSPPSMANILTEHVTESLAFSPASVVIDSVAAANTLLYSQQSDSFSHPSDLLSPQLSDSLPTSPSSICSTLSDYCIDVLFDDDTGVNCGISTHPSTKGIYYARSSDTTSRFPSDRKQCMPVVFTANLRGGFCAKLDEMSATMQDLNVDIACFTETWLNEGILPILTQIGGYTTYRLDRSDGRKGGGIAVLVKNDLPCQHLTDLSKPPLETLWLLFRRCRMPRSVTHVLIGCIYHPPAANNNDMVTHIVETLDHCSKNHPNLGIILIGDFNKLPDSVLKSYPLRQVVKGETRNSATLDKIYTDLADFYSTPVIGAAISKSDHNTVLFYPLTSKPRVQGFYRPVRHRSNSANGKIFLARALATHNWSPLYHMHCVDDMLQYFYSTILSMLDTYLPLVQSVCYSTDKPWVTKQFRQLIRSRQFAFCTGDSTRYRKLRNKAQRLAKKLQSEYYERKVDHLAKSSSRSWWQKQDSFSINRQVPIFTI